jgi:L-iditol 2-dehydrogenase
MRQVELTALRAMQMREVETPRIQEAGDVLVKMTAIGVCGSDVHYYTTGRIGSQVVEYPFVVGHECAGTVAETGPEVRGLSRGDRVAIEPAMPCHSCDQCRIGRHHTCRKLRFLGCPGQARGCLSDYIVMPASSCFIVPESVGDEAAAFAEPLSIGIYSVEISVPMKGARIAILGAGPIGMSVMLAALAQGVSRVYVTDRIEDRIRRALDMGAYRVANPDTTDITGEIIRAEPGGLDAVFECCGQQDAVDQAVDLLRPGGKLMMVGIPETDRISVKIDTARRREICFQNVRRQNNCMDKAIRMVASGAVPIDKLVTHRFSLEQTQKAFDLAAAYGDGVLKAVIRPNG